MGGLVTTAQIREFDPGDETTISAGHHRALERERPLAHIMTTLNCLQADYLELKTGNPTNDLERRYSASQGAVAHNLG